MLRSVRVLLVVALVCGSVSSSVSAHRSWQPVASCGKFHVALPNDSWSRLAVRFGLGEPALYRLNRASASSFLRVGDRVCVGVKVGASPTTTTTTTTTTTVALPVAPVLTVGELTACQPVTLSWRGASPDTGWYSLQWVRVSGSGGYDFTNSYSMFNVRGTSTSLSNWFGSGATYAIRVFAMRADWDGVWHSTQNVTPHSQVVTFTVPGCAPAAEATTTSITTTTTTVPPGAVDTGFNPNVEPFGRSVFAVAVQSDGKIIIGGSFTTVGGTARNYVARLNSDGTLDAGFNPDAGGNVFAVAVQSDGKILVGGSFMTVGGVSCRGVARLNSNGTLDTGFCPNVVTGGNGVEAVAVQSDGKIIIGGSFTTVGGTARNNVARLNSNGSLDTGFNPNANGVVYSAVVQSDGKIIIGGSFTTVGGTARNNVARLNSDGTLDTGFNPDASSNVLDAVVQSDGKIIIGGNFTTVGGTARNLVARLNSDGTLDPGFNPNVNGIVYSAVVQSDGKIVIGGSFTTVGGTARNRVARLESNGTLDTGFDPDAGGNVLAVAVQSDGKVIIGGNFTTVGGTTRNRLARLS
jgi:uncharacterized delta-60 repeat protein